jgi:hypothetical protein
MQLRELLEPRRHPKPLLGHLRRVAEPPLDVLDERGHAEGAVDTGTGAKEEPLADLIVERCLLSSEPDDLLVDEKAVGARCARHARNANMTPPSRLVSELRGSLVRSR